MSKALLALPVLCALLAPARAVAQPPGGPPGGGNPGGGNQGGGNSSVTVEVDCATESINDALASAQAKSADEVTVEFSGTCVEDVDVLLDHVAIIGTEPNKAATLVGGIRSWSVNKSESVALENFTISGPARTAVEAASTLVTLQDIDITNGSSSGITAFGSGTFVQLQDVTVNSVGAWGIAVWSQSHLQMGGQIDVQGAAAGGILVNLGGELWTATTAPTVPVTLRVHDNPHNGILLGDGTINVAPASTVLLDNNALSGILVFKGGSFSFDGSGSMSVLNNSSCGILVQRGGQFYFNTFGGPSGGASLAATGNGGAFCQGDFVLGDSAKSFIGNAAAFENVSILWGATADFGAPVQSNVSFSVDPQALCRGAGTASCP